MTKVSPGPWTLLPDGSVDSPSRIVADACSRDYAGDAQIDIDNKADERAILATPRTLELLRRFVDELQYTAWVTEPMFADARALLAEIEGE